MQATHDSKCTTMQGEPWLRVVVVGQSFMMHQIRKMVGTVIGIMRGTLPPAFLASSLRPEAIVPTPIAPDVGLFLDECIFASYNARWGTPRNQELELASFQEGANAFKVIGTLE